MPDEKLARALGAKVRRDIIKLLLKGESSVCDVAKSLDLTEVNASKHLKKLFDLGLLETKLDGRNRFYSIKFGELKSLIKEFDKFTNVLGGNKG